MKRQKRGCATPSTSTRTPTPDDLALAQAREAARLLLSPEEAAERMQLARATIYRLCERGELRSIKVGAARRIPVRELEAYIASRLPDGSPDGSPDTLTRSAS